MTDRSNGEEGPGLPESDQPGKRSGSGAQSVVDQMHKDQQRNSNEPKARDEGHEDPPPPARESGT